MADGLVINDTTYSGEAASAFILRAITGNDTIKNGNAYIKDGIKKKFTIPRWDSNYASLIQDRKATPTSQGSMTVTGQAINPQDYMIYVEFNPRDFEDHWFAIQLNPTLIDRTLPQSAESVVVQGVMARHAKFMNQIIWSGDTTRTDYLKYFNGWVTKAIASSNTLKVAGTTLTAGNIQAEMLKCYNKIPAALRYDPAMKFFVSYDTFDLFAQSQIAQTYKGIDTTQEAVPYFKGRKVERIADFPADTILVAKGLPTTDSNLWVGMNSIDDEGLKLAHLQPNSEYWFVKMLMKLDVNFGFDEEVVIYSTSIV